MGQAARGKWRPQQWPLRSWSRWVAQLPQIVSAPESQGSAPWPSLSKGMRQVSAVAVFWGKALARMQHCMFGGGYLRRPWIQLRSRSWRAPGGAAAAPAIPFVRSKCGVRNRRHNGSLTYCTTCSSDTSPPLPPASDGLCCRSHLVTVRKRPVHEVGPVHKHGDAHRNQDLEHPHPPQCACHRLGSWVWPWHRDSLQTHEAGPVHEQGDGSTAMRTTARPSMGMLL